MKPAICTSFGSSIPFERVVPLIRQAGFEVVSVGADPRHSGYATPAGRRAMLRLLASHGLAIDSVHAPFPEGDQLFSLVESERLESVRQCEVALEAADELAGRIVVVHLIQPYGIPRGSVRDRMITQGRRSVEALARRAARLGVQLALENGQEADYDQVLADFLAVFSGGPVGFCYDSGHEHVQGRCFALLERFAQRLLTVHIHDNCGSDTHVLPYEGTIDWERFRQVFHRLGYGGNLLLEADIGHSAFSDPAVFLAEARARAGRLLEVPSPGPA